MGLAPCFESFELTFATRLEQLAFRSLPSESDTPLVDKDLRGIR